MAFRKFAILSLLSIYLLILAGGIVRSTGSGMGCPDWPKCFGRFIPPTKVEELPLHYEVIYQDKLHGEVEFNATKTWIEYINRLLGALTGIIVLITTALAYREGSKVFMPTLASLALILANAILGKYVVDSFLLPGVVTAHMLLSIGVIYFLVKALNNQSSSEVISLKNRQWIGISMLVVFIQIILGTQVRENMDHVIKDLGESAKGQWIDHLDLVYIIHRTFSWVILLCHLILWKKLAESPLHVYRKGLLVLLSISFITGVLMAYFALPLGSQAVHLMISLVLMGWHISSWIQTKNA
ncbi:COX15/CtaA family protein [Aquirufa sp. HETE-83D]|uniref:COX15/CtaA family protein n=1 Tax=Aquirufa esocilacus TaxID=3096513 RepID=A0ABW6DN66_9BACT